MFWDEKGGGLTGQPVGPEVDTATIRTVLSTHRVDSGRFSSRCCAVGRTHTSADPIRLHCIRLALPLTLSLPSQFAPSARLMVGGTSYALWFSGDSSYDCIFWDKRGGELTGQPVGPTVGTTTMTAVMSANRVTRLTRPDYAVMCNSINTHTHTHTHTQIHTRT